MTSKPSEKHQENYKRTKFSVLAFTLTTRPFARSMDRCENWATREDCKMRLLLEAVIIVVVIYIAVRMFRKRG